MPPSSPTPPRPPRPRRSRVWRVVSIVAATAMAALLAAPSARAVVAPTQINGDGSSWAYNAVNQWISDVASQQQLKVNFTSTGSAQGRSDFANHVVDFAVSDIGYQGHDPLTGAADSSSRSYAYVPIVAGGTAFPYKILVGGKPINNLRLSGATLAKIFTNRITNWNDPAITADNNGRVLPSLPIIPVVHSEGAGSTYMFTQYLAQNYGSLWGPFAGANVPTEYWPRKGAQIADNGSATLINTIISGSGNGTIGYDEYSYALQNHLPVANLENAAGYFTLPTQFNVAVALTQAQINYTPGLNYLLQTLTNVYGYNDPRTYPLSSYSYGIIPTSATMVSNAGGAQTLANYLDYSTCQGQAEVGPIGYSSLPINLVEASFKQIQLLGAAYPGVDVSQAQVSACNNPTFIPGQPNVNHLAVVAPNPPLCDKSGEGPCVGTINPLTGLLVDGSSGVPAATTPTPGQSTPGGGSTGPTARASGTSHTATAASGGGAVAGSTSAASGSTTGASSGSVDPLTGQSSGDDSGVATSSDANYAASTNVPADGNGDPKGALAVVAVALLILILGAPPVALRAVRRRAEA